MSKGSPHLCKPCRNAATRAWAEANPSQWERNQRRSYLRRKYGMTEADYDALLEAQGGLCAICGGPPGDSRGFRPHIDHCHKTGRVRGILCNLCNQGLGGLRDDPEILRSAIAYLLRHREAA
ncbi:endonuclease VII domain-containing protein [Phytohabitans houttuyneae]